VTRRIVRYRFQPVFNGSWSITVTGKGELLSQDILADWLPGALEIDESCERPDYIDAKVYGLWKPTPDQLTTFAKKYFGLSGYSYDDQA
jgi:hypothetical protein